MKKIKRKINFKDNRGFIIDLLEKKNINAITLITQKNYSMELLNKRKIRTIN